MQHDSPGNALLQRLLDAPDGPKLASGRRGRFGDELGRDIDDRGRLRCPVDDQGLRPSHFGRAEGPLRRSAAQGVAECFKHVSAAASPQGPGGFSPTRAKQYAAAVKPREASRAVNLNDGAGMRGAGVRQIDQQFRVARGDAQATGVIVLDGIGPVELGLDSRGLGNGIQKFGYLPEDHTDFIFAVICEELGIVGGFIVIGIFIMLLWQLRRAMMTATDRLGQLIVLGVMLTIGLQAALNIGVVSGALPTKGIALPFVSAGGSGLIVTSIALGLAASVARGARKKWA